MAGKHSQMLITFLDELRAILSALHISPPEVCTEADAKVAEARRIEAAVSDEPEPPLDGVTVADMERRIQSRAEYRIRHTESVHVAHEAVAQIESSAARTWDASAPQIIDSLRKPLDAAVAQMTDAGKTLSPYKTVLAPLTSRSYDYDREAILNEGSSEVVNAYQRLCDAVAVIDQVVHALDLLHNASTVPEEPEEFGNIHRVMYGFRADLAAAAGSKHIAVGSQHETYYLDLLAGLPAAKMHVQTPEEMWKDYQEQKQQRRAEWREEHRMDERGASSAQVRL